MTLTAITRHDVIRLEDSPSACFDYYYRQGWTDGLPIIPPTPDLVEAMMSTVNLPPRYVVGLLAPRNGEATIEKIAINAVMAGCLPEYFPVLVTAIELVAESEFGLGRINSTTNPAVPMLIVNGPIREQINLNCSYGVLGPGFRANATIGRAFSLCMINLAGRIPGEVCKSTHKHPGAYTMCFGEFEERSPWEPLHVERGFAPMESTVTVIATTGTTNMLAHDCGTAEEMLAVFTGSTAILGNNNLFPSYGTGQMVFLVCPDHATVIAKEFTKQQVKEYLLEHTVKVPISWLPKTRRESMLLHRPDQLEGEYLRLAKVADDFLIVVAGGLGGLYSQFIPSAGGRAHTKRMTAHRG